MGDCNDGTKRNPINEVAIWPCPWTRIRCAVDSGKNKRYIACFSPGMAIGDVRARGQTRLARACALLSVLPQTSSWTKTTDAAPSIFDP